MSMIIKIVKPFKYLSIPRNNKRNIYEIFKYLNWIDKYLNKIIFLWFDMYLIKYLYNIILVYTTYTILYHLLLL